MGELFAELLGRFILIGIGIGAGLMLVVGGIIWAAVHFI
jgi:hypothetical protein